MRHAATVLIGLAVALAAGEAEAAMGVASVAPPAPARPIVKAEYYCSPGYVLTYGDRCVATASRDEVELLLNEPVYDGGDAPVRRVRRIHRRKGLHERY